MKVAHKTKHRDTGRIDEVLERRIVVHIHAVLDAEVARVRREEAEFHQLAGARAVVEALDQAGALTEAAKEILRAWDQARGYQVISFNGVKILPPVMPQ